MQKISKICKYLLYILPLTLFFSYFPLIKLGENETMYFELSLPLIWLALFDILGLVFVVLKYRREIFTKIFGSVLWWLFPIFATFSVIWSLNHLRGVLTVGVMWAVFFAVLFFYEMRENLDAKFFRVFLKWFFGAALFVCFWCALQCVLDVFGVSQDATLLCDGCVYQMFGFPHPNGFAIEPQFMGNLLLAPALLAMYLFVSKKDKKYLFLFAVFVATLFLTMSRGAIYACVVGLIFLDFFMWARAKKSEKKVVCKDIMKTVGVFVASFVFTLNLQGVLTASSPTLDTYFDGVAKVVNQLSLGIIDLRGAENEPTGGETSGNEPVENSSAPVENLGGTEAVFDGYVAESTDTRVRLVRAALDIWKKDFKTIAVGVGIGGAGQALYDNGLSPAPREIVQNEYASLLLETGLIGVVLFVVLLVMTVKVFLKSPNAGLLLGLMVSYGVSLLFFSGLTNALQIVLLPGILVLSPGVLVLFSKNKKQN